MAETITPVVHGGSRSRWAVSVTLHVLGAGLAAAAFGALLGAAGGLLGAPWGAAGWWLVAAIAIAYLVAEATGLRVPVPQLRRQVPDWWRTFFGPAPAAFLYGAGLGVGFLTYLTHGTLVVVALAAVASGQSLAGALLVAPFGVARALTVVAARGVRSPAEAAELVGSPRSVLEPDGLARRPRRGARRRRGRAPPSRARRRWRRRRESSPRRSSRARSSLRR